MSIEQYKKKPGNILLRRVLAGVFQAVFIFVLVFGSVVVIEYAKERNKPAETLVEAKVFKKSNSNVRVLAETDQEGNASEGSAELKGERYAGGDVTMGGETLMAMTDDSKSKQIEISQIRGRLYRSNEKDEVDYYTTWKSNKPTMATVKYKTEEEDDYKKISENEHSYVYAATLPELDFSKAYEYVIESQDRWGNRSQTENYLFYTGETDSSFIDILEKSFNDVFGWMR
ncbi:MAG: hypothetical protein U5L10_05195 [Candidatus Moranbacteria bacterium]|nr:hypothetical protein [Candidatus Moranbacteria bacterium]